jgi:hypothetical protein
MARHVWTDNEVVFLHLAYANTTAQQIAAVLGIEAYQVYQKAHRLGLEKSDEFNRSALSGRLRTGDLRGIDTRFKPGNKPWIAGRKVGTRGRTAETQFRPGQKPPKYLPVGSVREIQGYYQVKLLADGPHTRTWAFVHQLVWELNHGPLPPGHCIKFRDGNKLNTDPDNLLLISRRESMRGNSIHGLPPEVIELKRLRGRITRAINQKEKKANEQHQRTA